MKSIFRILPLLVLIISGCSNKAQIVIGKYYKVSDGLSAQYPNVPEPSEGAENEYVSSKEFRYAFPTPENDGNVMYSIAIYKIKKNANLIDSDDKKVDYVVSIIDASIPAFLKGNVDKEEKIQFKDHYAIRHTARVFAPFLNDKIFVNSVFFKHKDFVIRAYVYTTKDKENNDHIQAFFDNIQIE